MKAPSPAFYQTLIESTVRTIHQSLDRALDLEALACAACLSPFHFHRMFRGLTGETPLEFHRRLRMERAASCLLKTDEAIIHIAFEAGFETHEAFTRLFRSLYACSPTTFRKSRNPVAAGIHATYRPLLGARSAIHFNTPESAISGLLKPLFNQLGEPVMHVDIVQLPQQRLATLPHLGPYNRISEAFEKIGAIAGPAGLFGPDTAMLALYYDDPESTPPDELRSDAALTVSADRVLPATLIEKSLPAGRYARTMHNGGYALLGDTWARFMGQWLPQSGHRMGSAASFERYLNTPMDVPVEQLRTELYIHLE
jgi:AraC family transcriptional regulator